MSGEVKVRKSDWQRTLAAVLLGCLLGGVLMYLFLRRVELTGLARGIVAALGAYVLFRLFYPMLRGLFPGGGERTVQPGGHDHSAVAFHVQLDAARSVHVGVLDAPGGGVGMAGSNAPAANGVGRHPPGNDGTFVAGHIVTVFRFQIPVFGFLQAGVTGGIQQLGCSVYRVERRH